MPSRDFPTGGWKVAGGNRAEFDAVVGVPQGCLDPALRVGDPRVHFAARDAHQTAGRVQPERVVVVLYRPVNRVAGQAVFGGERCDAATLDPAQAALLGCGPQRPICGEFKTGNMALSQPLSGGVRRADLAILEIQHAAVEPE